MSDRNFKVGDRVSWLGLKGTVAEIKSTTDEQYPVRVEFDDRAIGTSEFTNTGCNYIGQRPSLKKLKKKKARYFQVGISGPFLLNGKGYSTTELLGHWLKDCGTKKPKGA